MSHSRKRQWKWESLAEKSGGKENVVVLLGQSMSLSDWEVGEKQSILVLEELENETM